MNFFTSDISKRSQEKARLISLKVTENDRPHRSSEFNQYVWDNVRGGSQKSTILHAKGSRPVQRAHSRITIHYYHGIRTYKLYVRIPW